jgi:hypothetical protein
MIRKRNAVLCAATVAAIAGPVQVFGQIYTWINPAGGSYQDAGNWSPAGPPSELVHTALFNQNADYGVNLSSNVTAVGTLALMGGTVTFGGGLKRYKPEYVVLSNGSLKIQGPLTFDPQNSVTINAGAALLGSDGSSRLFFGNLVTVNGGMLIAPGASTVSGTLTVQAGGTVSFGGNMAPVLTGTVRVTDGLLTAGEMIAANTTTITGANSRMSVSGLMAIGSDTNPAATISFQNGSVGSFSTVQLGNGGSGRSGTFNISSSTVTSDKLLVANDAGANGLVSLTGATASLTVNASAPSEVGSSGAGVTNGTIAVAGGTLTNSGSAMLVHSRGQIDVQALGTCNSLSAITIDGGTISTAGRLIVDPAQPVTLTNGGRFLLTGGTLSAGAINVGAGCLFQQSGGIIASSNGMLVDGGTLAGNFSHGGTLTLNNATLSANASNAGTVLLSGVVRGTGTLTSQSHVTLAGGTFAAGKLVNDYGAVMTGGGTITAEFDNNGQLAPAGSLNLAGFAVNRGQMVVGAGTVVRPTGFMSNMGLIDIAGGVFTSGNLSNFSTGGVIRGYGSIMSSLTNGGMLIADGGLLTVGSLSSNGASGDIQVRDDAVMSLSAGMSSDGAIELFGPGAQLSGATITLSSLGSLGGTGLVKNRMINGGRITPEPGLLTFNGVVTNSAGGVIDIPTGARARMATGIDSQLGTIFLGGGTLDCSSNALVNSGIISGRGSIRAGSLSNTGTITLSGGTSDIFPALTQSGTAKTIVTGFGTTTFYANVSNNVGSELRVSTGAVAVFLGNVAGLSAITGGGVKVFEGSASGGPLVTSGQSIVGSGAVIAAGGVRENALQVDGVVSVDGAITSRLSQLTIAGAPGAWTGRLDLNNDSMILDYASTSPLAVTADQIKAGFHGGDWLGNGIVTSDAGSGQTALGYGESSSLLSPGGGNFLGESVDGTSVLIRYVFRGDANLDGTVNSLDFTRFAGGYGNNSGSAIWTQGDFDYNGKVSTVDFNYLAGNFGQMVPAALPAPALAAVVPEPLLTAMPCLLLLLRRRHGR